MTQYEILLSPIKKMMIDVIAQNNNYTYMIFEGDFDWAITVNQDLTVTLDENAKANYSYANKEIEIKYLEDLSFFDLSFMAEEAARMLNSKV